MDDGTRRPPTARWEPRTFDRVFALGFTAAVVVLLGAAGWAERHEGIPGREWALAGAQAIGALALWARRRHPYAVAAFCTLLSIPEQLAAVPFAMYAVGAYGGDRNRVFAAAVPLSAVWARPWDFISYGDMLGSFLIALAPAVYGLYVASRRRLILALEDRAERAEREQELRAEQARSEERVRLAGEMHDVVTHRVSLMVLQAGALRTRARDDESREGLDELRGVGRQALQELRDLVTILRSEDQFGSARAAEPAALDLTALAAESRTAGVEVELAVPDEPLTAPPVVVRTAYRIVQESLTNVHKHAPGATVRVRVAACDRWLRLHVRNTPPTRDREISLTGPGTGLDGLRRRVEMIDGSLRTGPTGDGGFEVAADLPLHAEPGTPHDTSTGAR